MGNYGISIAGRQARREGRGPASVVAGWVGHGLTAGWLVQNCASCEWHHSQANLGGHGSPTDYYDREAVLAAWLAANLLAAHGGDAPARRRCGDLRRLRLLWGVRAHDVAYLVHRWRESPPAIRASVAAADPLLGKWVRLRRRWSDRQRSRHQRYTWHEAEYVGYVTSASKSFLSLLLIDGQPLRCGRTTILAITEI